jgi:hypothetical protein
MKKDMAADHGDQPFCERFASGSLEAGSFAAALNAANDAANKIQRVQLI